MRRKSVTVHLVGGLGNQLYGYYAGLYLSQKLNLPLVLDLSEISRQHKNSTIEAFDLNCKFSRNYFRIAIRKTFLARISDSVLLRSTVIRIFCDSLTKTYRESESKKLGGGDLLVIPDNILFKKFGGGVHLIGSFANGAFFEECMRFNVGFKDLKLRNPSREFNNLKARMKLVEPICMHLRRGDYDSLRNSNGVLSLEYYLEGLSYLKNSEKSSNSSIWVFSDDSLAAENFVYTLKYQYGLHNFTFEIFSDLEISSAAETLRIIGYSKYLILANSSFSRFAALLWETKECVVCPATEYRIYERTPNLISDDRPASWVRLRSFWLNENEEYA